MTEPEKFGAGAIPELAARNSTKEFHEKGNEMVKELTHPACGRVFNNGWQILAVEDSSPRSAVIMAFKDGEYVVARMYDPVNDEEWSNGFYTRNGETAMWNFRHR